MLDELGLDRGIIQAGCTDSVQLWQSSDPLDVREASVSGARGLVLAMHDSTMQQWEYDAPGKVLQSRLESEAVRLCFLAA